jgi:Fe2+ or Zn2+ uptake regulation protein
MKNTYYTLYTKWLQDDGLGLSIVDASVLSVIYGLSRSSAGVCKGSNYIASELNLPARTVYRSIDRLIEKNLIDKVENGRGKQNYFRATKYCQNVTSDKMAVVTQSHPTSDRMSPELVTQSHPTSDRMSPETSDTVSHNIYINNTKDIARDKKKSDKGNVYNNLDADNTQKKPPNKLYW